METKQNKKGHRLSSQYHHFLFSWIPAFIFHDLCPYPVQVTALCLSRFKWLWMVCGKNVSIYQAWGSVMPQGMLASKWGWILHWSYREVLEHRKCVEWGTWRIYPVFGEGRNRAWICNYVDVEHLSTVLQELNLRPSSPCDPEAGDLLGRKAQGGFFCDHLITWNHVNQDHM